MGVGGGGRNGLSQRAARKPVVNLRSDTLPDWRPAPGSFERAAKPAPAAHSVEDADLEAQPAGTGSGLERLLNVRFWPLAVVLAIQAALSLRLVWSATAFLDEGEYLTVGRLELAHLLHHAPMPNVATYLSGSPVVYPPLAAIADDIGGLAGARLLSLVFMLIATTALHGVTRRLLSSRPAAFYAAALFAWLGTAEFLGAFATYDAMALMLLAVATWLGVRAIDADYWLRYGLLVAGGLSIALADAAKYASTLFNPVVIGVVLLAAWRADGRRTALDAAGAMLLAAAVPLTVGYDVGGSSYGAGITSTTLTRTQGVASVRSVLERVDQRDRYRRCAGGARRDRHHRPASGLDDRAAGLRAGRGGVPCASGAGQNPHPDQPVQARWLRRVVCLRDRRLPAGRAARAARAAEQDGQRPPGRPAPVAALGAADRRARRVAVVLVAGVYDIPVANGQYGDWADSGPMIAEMSKLVTPSGYYMVEDPSVATYYLGSKVPFSHIDSTYANFSYTDPQTHKLLIGYAAFADSISRGYFNDIVLAFGDTFGQDQAIVQDMNTDHNYRLIDTIPYRTSYGPGHYEIFQRIPKPPVPAHRKRAHRRRQA